MLRTELGECMTSGRDELSTENPRNEQDQRKKQQDETRNAQQTEDEKRAVDQEAGTTSKDHGASTMGSIG